MSQIFTVLVYPYVPIGGVIISVGLIAFIVLIEIVLHSVFILISVGWYLVYTRQRTHGYHRRLVIKSLARYSSSYLPKRL